MRIGLRHDIHVHGSIEMFQSAISLPLAYDGVDATRLNDHAQRSVNVLGVEANCARHPLLQTVAKSGCAVHLGIFVAPIGQSRLKVTWVIVVRGDGGSERELRMRQ